MGDDRRGSARQVLRNNFGWISQEYVTFIVCMVLTFRGFVIVKNVRPFMFPKPVSHVQRESGKSNLHVEAFVTEIKIESSNQSPV